MIDARTLPDGYSIYSFVAHDGTNTHIDCSRLREWCLANVPTLNRGLAPVDAALAQQFVQENVVDLDRVFQLQHKAHLDPIIYCEDGTFSEINGGPNVMLVDGHHRYALAALMRRTHIPAFLITLEQWTPFQIINHPDLTEEYLRATPVTKRHY